MIPKQAPFVFLLLLGIGLVAGFVTDILFAERTDAKAACHNDFDLHEENLCHCFSRENFLEQWAHCSAIRTILSGTLLTFLLLVVSGKLGPDTWNWLKTTLVILSIGALVVVATVPDHFLEEHLWNHVVINHIPRVFFWTFGALLLMHVLVDHLHLEGWMQQNQLVILLIACLVGLIPESGPHLLFLTLFAENTLPFSIFLASSIVQDGHGMLPLLAESQRDFLKVKAINFVVGLLTGVTGYIFGW